LTTAIRTPLLIPDIPDAGALLPYLRRIDAARWYSNFGPLVGELESRLASSFAAANPQGVQVATVSNATAGLELALAALNLPAGAKVLLPALTFVATAAAVQRAGHVPVACDVDADNWLLTPQIASHVVKSRRIEAVMPVATFGVPVDAAAWQHFSAEQGIPVIIDAAAAFGNQQALAGLTAVYSMHATKPLAAGEGGFVVSANKALVERIRRLSNFGINLGDVASVPIGVVARAGTNAKMSEYHAAVGLASLDRWESSATRRLVLAERYLARMHTLTEGKKVQVQAGSGATVRSVLCFAFADDNACNGVREHLAHRGIASRTWYCPLIPDHPAFAGSADGLDLPVARHLSGRLMGLPFYPAMADSQWEEVCEVVAAGLRPATA
jgi:dTDP-4-amino-4,6-dideoxygalactose transaminase